MTCNPYQVRAFILLALRRKHGGSMSKVELQLSIGQAFPGAITDSETGILLSDMEAEDLVGATIQPVLKTRSYHLTPQGSVQAQTLG